MTKTILLDIEGTTTPIDFVHQILFPFAKKRIGGYVEANFRQITEQISLLETEYSDETAYGVPFDANSPRSVSDYLNYLIDVDRKSTPLKTIQGSIWQQGYEADELKSEVYDDVPPAFERWQNEGRTIAMYSSGSALAQKLLFKHTNYGNLTPYISNYFDTNIGGKRDVKSYLAIAELLKLPPAEILFVSDIPAELTAAQDAGLLPVLSVRPGNTPVDKSEDWRPITSFDQIDALLSQ